jgi:hypothetical protein
MTTYEILKFTGINAVLIAAIQLLATNWLKAHFDRQLELFRFEQLRRERAAMIAELFAEWVSKPTDSKRLNQLTWEASLWLPADIVLELSKRLSNATDAKDMKEIIVAVRRHLIGETDAVEAQHIIHFDPPGQGGAT